MMLLLYITKPVPADYKRNNFVILWQLFSAALYIEMYILHKGRVAVWTQLGVFGSSQSYYSNNFNYPFTSFMTTEKSKMGAMVL